MKDVIIKIDKVAHYIWWIQFFLIQTTYKKIRYFSWFTIFLIEKNAYFVRKYFSIHPLPWTSGLYRVLCAGLWIRIRCGKEFGYLRKVGSTYGFSLKTHRSLLNGTPLSYWLYSYNRVKIKYILKVNTICTRRRHLGHTVLLGRNRIFISRVESKFRSTQSATLAMIFGFFYEKKTKSEQDQNLFSRVGFGTCFLQEWIRIRVNFIRIRNPGCVLYSIRCTSAYV